MIVLVAVPLGVVCWVVLVEGGVFGTVASTVVVSSFGGFLDGEGGGVVIVNVSMMMHE